MTDEERDAAAATDAAGAADEDAADAEEPQELDEDDELEDDEEQDEEPAPGFAPIATPTPAGPRRLRGQPTTAAAPTASERAVHVDDRFSRWFVIAIVAVFGLIFANAILFGHAGFVTGLMPKPTPVITASPTVGPSSQAPSSQAPSSSESAAPSASGSAAPSSSAGASSSAAPSSSASAGASPAPSAAASPSGS